MLAWDFIIPISSTSLPGGNLVDGLPPAARLGKIMGKLKFRDNLNIRFAFKDFSTVH